MLPGDVPGYFIAPLLGCAINGVLAVLCLAIFSAYRAYRPLKSLSLFYLTLCGYFLGFAIYGLQISDASIIQGYRLMLLCLCFAPVAWVWFALRLQNVPPGPWAWGCLAFGALMAAILLLVEHPAVLGPPFYFHPKALVRQPSSTWFKPVLYVFDLLVVSSTLFLFWFRWWPAPGKPIYLRALLAGLALWLVCGLHDVAYGMHFPLTLGQPIAWLGSIWLSVCLAVAIAFHLNDLEKSLRQSEEKFAKAFAAHPEGIALATRDEVRFLEVNQAFVNFCGHGRGKILGSTCRDLGLLLNPGDHQRLLDHLALEDEARDLEMRFKAAGGEVREALVSAQPMAFGGRECLLMVTRDVTRERQAAGKIQAYQEKLRFLSSELSAAEERERRRLAEGLHDQVTQALVICSVKLQNLGKELADSPRAGVAQEIVGLLQQAIKDTRTLTFEISTPILYDLGLGPALEWLAEVTQQKHGLRMRFQEEGQPGPLGDELRSLLFRAAQELVMNVVKHSGAASAVISLASRPQEVELRVEDDGQGFMTQGRNPLNYQGFGLFSIRERLALMNGRMVIDSAPDQGCRVTLTAPVKPAAV